jgi:phosphoribosylformylglycinamidine synthase
MGERTPLAAMDAAASGRMAVAEALTNLLAAPIELPRVKLSANWMAACGEPGEDADLVRHRQSGGHGAVPGAGHFHPRGQGRLSMRTQWKEMARTAKSQKVTAPVSLIVTAFASMRRAPTCAATLTPQRTDPGYTTLVLIDLGHGRNRMAGSILAQVLGHQEGDNDVPDWTIPRLGEPGERRERAARQGKLLAYHDRSDGGLLATVAKWPLPATRAWR